MKEAFITSRKVEKENYYFVKKRLHFDVGLKVDWWWAGKEIPTKGKKIKPSFFHQLFVHHRIREARV